MAESTWAHATDGSMDNSELRTPNSERRTPNSERPRRVSAEGPRGVLGVRRSEFGIRSSELTLSQLLSQAVWASNRRSWVSNPAVVAVIDCPSADTT